MKTYPQTFPHFDTEEELHQLLLEALEDDEPGIEFGSEEWKRFRQELEGVGSRKLAS